MKIILVEGIRCVGKSYLIDNLDNDIQTYKFPFAKYFNDSFTKGLNDKEKKEANSKRELFYLTFGYDITLFDLMKNGIIKQNIIVDRGILSDIVFGIQSGRITLDDGQEIWQWICKEYSEYFEIVYIHTNSKEDNRNKDMWDIYDREKTSAIYQLFIQNIHIHKFKNKFDKASVIAFNKCIEKINNK